MRSVSYIIFVIIISALFSCRKYIPYKKTDILFLGHKGAGSNNFNDLNMENTIPSFIESLKELDGVETDVMMSLDGTLWMYHNEDINDRACTVTDDARMIPGMRDSEIEKIVLCHETKSDRLYKFSELIGLWNQMNREFTISIDIKASFDADFFDTIGGKDFYYQRLVSAIAKELKTTQNTNKILLEFASPFFLNELRSNDTTKNVLLFYVGNSGGMDEHIEKALERDYDGVSINYSKVSKEDIQRAKDLNLLVQVWTPYYRGELEKAFNTQPDFIQTDNILVKHYLHVE